MTEDIQSETPANQLPEAAKEIGRRTADAAKAAAKSAGATARNATDAIEDAVGVVGDSTKNGAKRATETARNLYRAAAQKAGGALAASKEYIGRNPVRVVLGSFAFGAAVGYMLTMARRKPTFGERYADEPLVAMREAILAALAPVTQGIHRGYDSARDGAGKVMDRVASFGPGRSGHSLSHHIGSIVHKLKFW